MARIVYVSYDGMADQLGQSQVLPYLRGLGQRGHRYELLSYEKPGEPLGWRSDIGDGIHWSRLRYHQTPTVPATSFDLMQAQPAIAALDLACGGADLLHVRSYVPCLMALAYSRLRGIPLLFDTRGAWPEGKVVGGTWSADGRLFRGTKVVERYLLRGATQITVLTNAFLDHLRTTYPFAPEIDAPISVIPTCVDLEKFSVAIRPSVPDEKVKTLVYVGSLGGVYLDELIARYYLAWRKHAGPSRLLVVSRQSADVVRGVLAAAGAESDLVYRSAKHSEVPGLMRSAHAGLSFLAPGPLMLGTAPTKIGEMLACGVPVAATDLGDCAQILEGSGAGVIVRDFDDGAVDRSAKELFTLAMDRTTATTAQRLADRWFSLDRAIDAYAQVYDDMLSKRAVTDRRWGN